MRAMRFYDTHLISLVDIRLLIGTSPVIVDALLEIPHFQRTFSSPLLDIS